MIQVKLPRGQYLLLSGLASIKDKKFVQEVEERAERVIEGKPEPMQELRGTHVRLQGIDYLSLCELAKLAGNIKGIQGAAISSKRR